jgi:hypothetical protein
MSCQDSKRACHRHRQAAYEAALAGMASGALRRATEIDVLISPNHLPQGAEDDRRPVGDAVVAALVGSTWHTGSVVLLGRPLAAKIVRAQ